jgi:translation initiation factor IF-1
MTAHGLLAFDGHVTRATPGGLFRVTLANNVEMPAKVCGNRRCHGIRAASGDRVVWACRSKGSSGTVLLLWFRERRRKKHRAEIAHFPFRPSGLIGE